MAAHRWNGLADVDTATGETLMVAWQEGRVLLGVMSADDPETEEPDSLYAPMSPDTVRALIGALNGALALAEGTTGEGE